MIDSIEDDAIGIECNDRDDKRINYSSITRAGAQRNDSLNKIRHLGYGNDGKNPSDLMGHRNKDFATAGQVTP